MRWELAEWRNNFYFTHWTFPWKTKYTWLQFWHFDNAVTHVFLNCHLFVVWLGWHVADVHSVQHLFVSVLSTCPAPCHASHAPHTFSLLMSLILPFTTLCCFVLTLWWLLNPVMPHLSTGSPQRVFKMFSSTLISHLYHAAVRHGSFPFFFGRLSKVPQQSSHTHLLHLQYIMVLHCRNGDWHNFTEILGLKSSPYIDKIK